MISHVNVKKAKKFQVASMRLKTLELLFQGKNSAQNTKKKRQRNEDTSIDLRRSQEKIISEELIIVRISQCMSRNEVSFGLSFVTFRTQTSQSERRK